MTNLLLQSDASALGGLVIFGAFWLICSLIVGVVGQNKTIGFGGSFALSLFLSPLIGFIVAIASPRKQKPQAPKTYKCNHCQLVSQQYSYYCPRCKKDNEGFTEEENKQKFT